MALPSFRIVPFTLNRQMVAASASVGREQNNIHAILEVDISEPRRLLAVHKQQTGESLSLTAYVIACLAQAVAAHPGLNAFRKGSQLILLNNVTISCLVERELDGENVPEPFGIQSAETKTYRQIHEEIRTAQQHRQGDLGDLSGMTWVRYIPGFLLRAFIKIAAKNVSMASRYGVIGVTAVGMYGQGALWFVPLSGATVTVTVGSIVERPCLQDGQLGNREHLCLTVTFNHDIVDGAPAARFLKCFSEILTSGELLREALSAPGVE